MRVDCLSSQLKEIDTKSSYLSFLNLKISIRLTYNFFITQKKARSEFLKKKIKKEIIHIKPRNVMSQKNEQVLLNNNTRKRITREHVSILYYFVPKPKHKNFVSGKRLSNFAVIR